MTYFARHNIGDTVAYTVQMDGQPTIAVATVKRIVYELKPYTGRVQYELSSGAIIDEGGLLTQRQAAMIDHESPDMFRALEEIGARISQMGKE